MKVMDALKRIKSGEHIMVTLPGPRGKHKKYSFKDGSEVGHEQIAEIMDFLKPVDTGLFEGSEPQSYEWAG